MLIFFTPLIKVIWKVVGIPGLEETWEMVLELGKDMDMFFTPGKVSAAVWTGGIKVLLAAAAR